MPGKQITRYPGFAFCNMEMYHSDSVLGETTQN